MGFFFHHYIFTLENCLTSKEKASNVILLERYNTSVLNFMEICVNVSDSLREWMRTLPRFIRTEFSMGNGNYFFGCNDIFYCAPSSKAAVKT